MTSTQYEALELVRDMVLDLSEAVLQLKRELHALQDSLSSPSIPTTSSCCKFKPIHIPVQLRLPEHSAMSLSHIIQTLHAPLYSLHINWWKQWIREEQNKPAIHQCPLNVNYSQHTKQEEEEEEGEADRSSQLVRVIFLWPDSLTRSLQQFHQEPQDSNEEAVRKFLLDQYLPTTQMFSVHHLHGSILNNGLTLRLRFVCTDGLLFMLSPMRIAHTTVSSVSTT